MISRRFIDRSDLERVVTKQIEELLYSLLSWRTGSFKFYENQFPTGEEITVRISVENVILEGLRRLDERNLVQDTFPDLDAVYTISASQAGRSRQVSLKANEWNIMALVDGHRSLEEVSRLSPLGREETLSRLAQLKLAGLITKTDANGNSSTRRLEEMISRLASLFEDYLTEKPTPRPGNRRVTQTYLENVD
jgi:hypothetical protein